MKAEVFLASALSVAEGINPSFLIGDLSGASQHSPSEAIKKPLSHHHDIYHLLRDWPFALLCKETYYHIMARHSIQRKRLKLRAQVRGKSKVFSFSGVSKKFGKQKTKSGGLPRPQNAGLEIRAVENPEPALVGWHIGEVVSTLSVGNPLNASLPTSSPNRRITYLPLCCWKHIRNMWWFNEQ